MTQAYVRIRVCDLLLLLFVVVYELSLALACAFVLYFCLFGCVHICKLLRAILLPNLLYICLFICCSVFYVTEWKKHAHTHKETRSVIGLSLSVSKSMEIHSGFSGFICLVYVFWWHFFQKYTVFVFSIYSISIGSLCFLLLFMNDMHTKNIFFFSDHLLWCEWAKRILQKLENQTECKFLVYYPCF